MSLNQIPIDVVDLLPILDKQLIDLLKSLSPEDWNRRTVAKHWKVKDVAAHLLDGNIRILSVLRDGYSGDPPTSIQSPQGLIDYLNGLNADWVKAMKRVSPSVLILLHETTGPLFCNYYKSLDPCEDAVFPVAWAGDSVSKNWKHIAREYTEKWLHQQQIRDAVGIPGLMTKELFFPFMDIFMLGLPHVYKDIVADEGTIVRVTITSDIGGSWFLERTNGQWILCSALNNPPDVEIQLPPGIAWKLFSKSIRPTEVMNEVVLLGDHQLGMPALSMVSVMA